jgi:uncharacterized membrane protein YccC
MLLLIPLLSGLDDRLGALGAEGGLDRQADANRRAAADWIAAGAPAQGRAALLDRICAYPKPADDWRGLLTESLMLRLRDLVEALDEAHGLLAHLHAPDAALTPRLARAIASAGRRPQHVDLPLALLSGATAVIAILICCALWIGLGWTDGATAAMMTAVFCCFFASLDDPAPQIANFGLYALASLPLAALYLFVILPAISGFTMLTLALAPALLVVGLYIAQPKTAGRALPFVITFLSALALQESFQPDFAGFINGNLAQFVGVFVSIAVTRTLRTISAETSVRRLLKRTWRGLAGLAGNRAAPDPNAFAALLVDRLALLSPKLAGAGEGRDQLGEAALADLRVAMNLVTVQGSRGRIAGPAAARLDAVSAQLDAHFSRLAREGRSAPEPGLLASLDAALGETAGGSGEAARAATAGLVGLRRNLFPAAPGFVEAAA